MTHSIVQIRSAFMGSTAAAAMSLAMLSTPALAQDAAASAAPASSETIIVTGSRIARPNLEQTAPVSVIGAEEVAFQQPISAEELLRDLPGTVPSIGPQTNNGSDGSARVNLRGLGSNRNLVLMNSRRVTPRSTDGVVDLNVIPVALIERVDVFTGGATTVYGADAVAGVVNFITRRDFSGVDLNANYGITERGDGASYRLDMTVGANFDDGRGNVVLNMGYTDTQPVLQGNRKIGTFARQSTKCTQLQIERLGCRPDFNNTIQGFPQGSPTAAPASISSPFVGRVDPTGTQFIVGVQNDYNFNPLNLFQTPLERFHIFSQGRYEISPAVEVYAEVLFNKTVVEINLAPAGVFGSVLAVPLNSPFLTAQQRQVLCQEAVTIPPGSPGFPTGRPGQLPAGTDCAAAIAAGTQIQTGVLRRFTEAGPRVQKYTTNMFQITGGARGGITDTLNWDLSFTHGESDRLEARTGWGLLSRVRSGVLGCPAGSAAGCVPINLFGPEGSITPQMLNYIDVPTFAFANTQFTSAQGIVSGDLGWTLPWAAEPIGVATGVEYRRYFAKSEGDATSRIPGEVLGAGAAALPIRGSYTASEVFGELIIPIVSERPFFHSLTAEGGVRYSDYSTSGGNWTWKAGGSWAPVPDIRFRGVYSRAVRAPNIAELFQPQVTALTARPTDPCQGTVAEVAARGANFPDLCRAQLRLVGAPEGLLGTITAPAAGQIQSTQGGNPNLDPETATTWTLGAVIQPRFLSNVSLTFDYFDIKVTDAITTPSQSDVIDGCFQANPIQSLCQQIFRNPASGTLSGPADTTFGPVLALSNLGTIKTRGFDLGANASHSFDWGRFALSFQGTWTQDFLFQATPLSINRQCVRFYSVSCGNPQPRFSSNARLTFTANTGSTVSLAWRHLSSALVEPVAPVPQRPVGTPTTAGPANIVDAYQRISPYDWFDLAFQQQIGDNLRVTLTVQNLFDKDPPDVGASVAGAGPNSGNTFPAVYDPLGRRFTMGVNLRF